MSGGAPQPIASVTSVGSASWSRQGTILFSADGLYAVPDGGGDVRKVAVDVEPAVAPFFLPDGRRFLFLSATPLSGTAGIYAASLDSPSSKLIVPTVSNMAYVSSHLLFHREGGLWAQPFEEDALEVSGQPTRILDSVAVNPNGRAGFSVSDNGVLIYRTGEVDIGVSQFVWRDRKGAELQAIGTPDSYLNNFRLSPDGTHIALSKVDPLTRRPDLHVFDLAAPAPQRYSFTGLGSVVNGHDVAWSPDGTTLAYSNSAPGSATGVDIFSKAVSNVGAEEPVLQLPGVEWVEDWSRDGHYLAFMNVRSDVNRADVWVLSLPDRKPFAIDELPFQKDEPHFSHDGKWLAYSSTESGQQQIYVAPIPPTAQKRIVSSKGGVQPRWRDDGRELYYLALDGTLMAVALEVVNGNVTPKNERTLFETGLRVLFNVDQYDVSSDGSRFLILKSIRENEVAPIGVVVNWMKALQRVVP